MIQRIQSVFLFIAGSIQLLFFWQPFAILQIDEFNFYELFVKGYVYENNIEHSYALLLFVILTTLFSFVIIFFYKKRILQMRLAIYNALLLFGLQGVMAYTVYGTSSKLHAEVFLQYPFVVPSIAAILHLIAFKYIKKDEELVRSADRIR